MMRGDDMAVVSRRNYIGRSIVVCRRMGEIYLVRYVDRCVGKKSYSRPSYM